MTNEKKDAIDIIICITNNGDKTSYLLSFVALGYFVYMTAVTNMSQDNAKSRKGFMLSEISCVVNFKYTLIIVNIVGKIENFIIIFKGVNISYHFILSS
jgi:hypothetical protein